MSNKKMNLAEQFLNKNLLSPRAEMFAECVVIYGILLSLVIMAA
jgi:hypothetical protein